MARFFPLERSLPRVEHIESLYVSGHFAFDPKTFYKKKVSKRRKLEMIAENFSFFFENRDFSEKMKKSKFFKT